ncbi:F0F1 ATP synthase subunit B [Lolliginicoccus suaedae]|uniref:F0F1 ATP synthase subunit B n=1 Tax=Lolliginicoccus suaedae TaxID=2605429 RepID=UPI0011ED933D|nr:F0F1 ATP synthase subunit B [Lolliginicoccus suaedae]
MNTANIVLLAAEGEPNPLLPAVYDIVWSIVALAVVGLVFWKFVIPPFQELLERRSEEIEGGMKRAEALQADAKNALEQYRAQLAEARSEAAKIREEARGQGQQIIDEMKQQAQVESDRIVANGQSQLEAQRQHIVADLRSDLGRTAVDLAEKIIGQSVADDAKRAATVDQFLNELESINADTATGK